MGALAAFWLPLALSWMMMIVAQPITAIAISRLDDPALHLAAYGITFDLAFLLESPIIMLLSVSVALTRDQASYRLLRLVTLWISGVMTGLFVIVAFTPAYDPVVTGLIGVPQEVAAQARPALRLLLPWIGAIAWRRFHQGPIITAGLTRLVSYGTVIRLATLSAVLWAGVAWPVLPGAMLGGLALSASVIVEAVVNTLWARPIIRTLPRGAEDPLTIPGVVRFCAPLAATDVMRTMVRPAVTAGVARAVLPEVSLAAWPVAASLIMLIGSATMAFQEVAVAVIEDRGSYLRVRRFIIVVGLSVMLLTVIIVMTPLIDAGLVGIVRLPGLLRPHVVQGLQIMVPLPMLLALRNLYRGVLIRQRSTNPIQLAMMANVIVLVMMLGVGVRAGWTGIMVAATATLTAAVAEAVVLYAFYRRAAQNLV
jgi:hypothetical protein